MPLSPDWVTLAIVTQPHGVRGQVKIKSFCDPEEGLADYALTDAKGTPIQLRLMGKAQGLLIASIVGIPDRNEAERWRGRELGIPRAALPTLKKDTEFYVTELVGMAVQSPDGKPMGQVAQVVNFGAGDLLEIGGEYYGFTHANFPTIDRAARIITFTPPEIIRVRAEDAAGEGSPDEATR